MTALREGSYTNADGSVIAHLDAQTVNDARDLYAVLQEQGPSGSSNLENDQVRAILSAIHSNVPDLTDAQWGVLKHLTQKYAGELARLRSSPDREGQDYSKIAPVGSGRVLKGKDGE